MRIFSFVLVTYSLIRLIIHKANFSADLNNNNHKVEINKIKKVAVTHQF